jgi:hypothetical protein
LGGPAQVRAHTRSRKTRDGSLRYSGRAPLVPVVKAANPRNGNDASPLGRLNRAGFRRVLGKPSSSFVYPYNMVIVVSFRGILSACYVPV